MPLIYGKTSHGFSDDLKLFFEKGGYYPTNKILLQLGAIILNTLKQHPAFSKITIFMKAMKAIVPLLFSCNKVILRNPYHFSQIGYNQQTIEKVRIYFKTKQSYKTQKIDLVKKLIDDNGNVLKSQTKTTNAFVANCIHFLDAAGCHFIINSLIGENKDFKIATIHDCFFIQPHNEAQLHSVYRQALLFLYRIHDYNLLCWIYDILAASSRPVEQSLLESLQKAKDQLQFNTLDAHSYITLFDNTDFIKQLELQTSNYKTPIRSKWATILEYLKLRNITPFSNFLKLFKNSNIHSLFIDNE